MTDASCDILPGSILIAPRADWLPVTGKILQLGKSSLSPITGANQDRNDQGFSADVPLERSLPFAGIGRQEVRADQQKNDVRLVQLPANGLGMVTPGSDLAIMPDRDHSLLLKHGQVYF